jgi:large subunit ribosomal protein L19
MSQDIIAAVEAKYTKPRLPAVRIGETVDVHAKIIEGQKERVQVFGGVIIARRGRGLSETLTVRRIVNNEGVERIFMLHSPNVVKIEVKRSGRVRRAKLYYLRQRVGKARRLRELRTGKGKDLVEPAAPTSPASAGRSKAAVVGQPA